MAKSRGVLANQMTVADIMKQQLAQAEIGLDKVAGTQENKMRMVEINTYYSDKYQAQAGLAKLIIVIGVAFLLIVVLMKRDLIPRQLAAVLVTGVLLIGGILVLMRYWNISSRDNMVFDEFNWNSNPPAYDAGAPPEMDMDMGVPCFNAACCADGTILKYGASLDEPNYCAPDPNYKA